MTKLLTLLGIPPLPYDVLRLVFEEATREDTRKAVKYTLISKLVRNWVEMYLYEDVQLYREILLRKFLRTLESSTKSRLFFATRVKSLSIVYDACVADRLARILSICSGVENLTLWAVPATGVSTHFYHGANYHTQPVRPSYPPLIRPGTETTRHYHQPHTYYLHALSRLRPKRLSILIHKPLHISVTSQNPHTSWTLMQHSPNFCLGIFSHLTHLTIVNGWTEWTTWAWSWTATPTMEALHPSKFLPSLTHLSLEIQVGKHTSQKNPERNCTLFKSTGRALTRILTSPELSPRLRVLLCIISFDDAPFLTAHKIREETFRSLIAPPHSVPGFHLNTSYTSSGEVSFKYGDPRLVFAFDGEPFSGREAGSDKVWTMWKRAEEIVRLQGNGCIDGEYLDAITFDL